MLALEVLFWLCAGLILWTQLGYALVLATDWSEYLSLEPAELRSRMRGDLVLDGRNAFDREVIEKAGLRYEGVGRGRGENAVQLAGASPAA